jgi:Metallo-peptidase family M12B Reprolysin-like
MRCAIIPVYCAGTARRTTYTKAWLERLGGALSAYYATQSGGRAALSCTAFEWQQLPLTTQQWIAAGTQAGRDVVAWMASDGLVSRDDFDHFVLLIDDAISSGGRTPHDAPETSLVAAVGVSPALVAHELGHRFGAVHTFLDSPDGPIQYGGPYCVMGSENGKHSFLDASLAVPAEGAPSPARNGPGMCFANLLNTGWADVDAHALKLEPYSDGTLGAVVQLAALDGAPPAGRPGLPVACVIELEDRYQVEYRSPTTHYDQDVPNAAKPAAGDLVVYRSPADGALQTLQVAAVAAEAGAVLSIVDPALAQALARKTGGTPGSFRLVVLGVDPGGRSVSFRVERTLGKPPFFDRTEGLMDYLRWALVDQPLPAHDDPVLTMLKALAEIHDLQRLQRISGPRDRAALARVLRRRQGDLVHLAGRIQERLDEPS